ncbi:hypothetical protein JIM95_002540 [Corynebacterium sp. CCM 8835]|uniref:Cell division protein FtsL n=1 Tax=Corynebacterium antarcticum TaxID=2800405 RepID=A0A9Q4CAW7_9CORY|nr:hypothetical protein [Corynebacterium antarcticum]MCK7641804.1 hypothetical protein [Corynebacterium antarcticum]MCL0245033.1 hypothetical protein [Corynebacterium antarcticum]MCX7491407.1 hypothetical protein [Corynebacterium antarcticum]MCX7537426.1 hypothetical protein [Corynebacterium antarcticum]
MSTTARLRATPEPSYAAAPDARTRRPAAVRAPGQTEGPRRGAARPATSGAPIVDLRPAPRTRPTRQAPAGPAPQRRRFQWTPGSRQVVSVRGRRIVAPKADPVRVRFAAALVATLLTGVMLTMYLSGVTTQQTFRLHELSRTDSMLGNQLETLNRDSQSARSSAEIARRAAELGMVVPDQPGVLSVGPDGAVDEVRAADPAAVRPIIDVNGSRVLPRPASSDPAETDAVAEQVQPLPQGGIPVPGQVPDQVEPVVGANSQVPAVAPYAPNVRSDRTGGSGQ